MPTRTTNRDRTEFETPEATVAINGRNVEVPEHFQIYVGDKLARLERFGLHVKLFEVELYHEPNPRQAKSCQRVEITARCDGRVARAEACADNFYAAVESVIAKLQSSLRKSHDRKRVHYGQRRPQSVAQATAELAADEGPVDLAQPFATTSGEPSEYDIDFDAERLAAGPGHVVRIKKHPRTPMSVDDALREMELVGHDFYLFLDKETDQASVVYRRRAFDYGLIRLG